MSEYALLYMSSSLDELVEKGDIPADVLQDENVLAGYAACLTERWGEIGACIALVVEKDCKCIEIDTTMQGGHPEITKIVCRVCGRELT